MRRRHLHPNRAFGSLQASNYTYAHHELQAIIATVSREEMAVATGGTPQHSPNINDPYSINIVPLVTYLFRTTGQVLGVSLSAAVLQGVLTTKLRERIQGPGSLEVCYIYASE